MSSPVIPGEHKPSVNRLITDRSEVHSPLLANASTACCSAPCFVFDGGGMRPVSTRTAPTRQKFDALVLQSATNRDESPTCRAAQCPLRGGPLHGQEVQPPQTKGHATHRFHRRTGAALRGEAGDDWQVAAGGADPLPAARVSDHAVRHPGVRRSPGQILHPPPLAARLLNAVSPTLFSGRLPDARGPPRAPPLRRFEDA